MQWGRKNKPLLTRRLFYCILWNIAHGTDPRTSLGSCFYTAPKQLSPTWACHSAWVTHLATLTEMCFLTIPQIQSPRSSVHGVDFLLMLLSLTCTFTWPPLSSCPILISTSHRTPDILDRALLPAFPGWLLFTLKGPIFKCSFMLRY